jgi:hypothetical protein
VVLEIVFLDLLAQLADFFLCGAARLSRHGIGWSYGHGASRIFNHKELSTSAKANEVRATLH